MSPGLVAIIIGSYFLVLILISWLTSKGSDSESFYTGNRQSPWYLVAFGMIGASLSGVTFISVPGEVGNSNWFYFQMVLGYILGYLAIAEVLLPLYYKLNLISIYSYLEDRFGFWAYKSGAFFFLISRIIGASFRLFLVAGVLQIAFFDAFGLPFWVAVVSAILLIWIYTFRGGIKTIVWTDTFQTGFMVLSLLISIYFIKDSFGWSWGELVNAVNSDARSKMFDWDWQSNSNFFKQFFAGAFIAIVMTGLDQDMMQKNLTCKSLKDAQKNVYWFTGILVIVNVLFLALGVLLYQFAEINSILLDERTDALFPLLAVNHFSMIAGIFFLLGITAAAYSSADSALTALTTSFCIDFLGFKPENFKEKNRVRILVHIGFSLILFMAVMVFHALNDESVINSIFKAAGYTYGPLLGMFVFGIYTNKTVTDRYVPIVCLASPIISFLININSEAWFGGYKFGFEILILNGVLTFIGMWILASKNKK